MTSLTMLTTTLTTTTTTMLPKKSTTITTPTKPMPMRRHGCWPPFYAAETPWHRRGPWWTTRQTWEQPWRSQQQQP
jgi:hypothetical protein